MAKICLRTSGVGRSTKKISSKRPLRSSSGGRASMSLAVATTNTGVWCSCIQVSSVPNIRCERPPSALRLAAEANAFSISSIHRITGAIISVWRRASRRLLLRFADVAGVQRARVQPQQRLLPGRGDRLGAEALARPLHAQHQDALGRRDAERLGLGAEHVLALVEPRLEVAHAADLVEVQRGLDVLEQAALLDHPPLVGDDDVDVVVVERLIEGHDVADDPDGLAARQAPQVADDRVEPLCVMPTSMGFLRWSRWRVARMICRSSCSSG